MLGDYGIKPYCNLVSSFCKQANFDTKKLAKLLYTNVLNFSSYVAKSEQNLIKFQQVYILLYISTFSILSQKTNFFTI